MKHTGRVIPENIYQNIYLSCLTLLAKYVLREVIEKIVRLFRQLIVVHSDDSMYGINGNTQVVLGVAMEYEKLCN